MRERCQLTIYCVSKLSVFNGWEPEILWESPNGMKRCAWNCIFSLYEKKWFIFGSGERELCDEQLTLPANLYQGHLVSKLYQSSFRYGPYVRLFRLWVLLSYKENVLEHEFELLRLAFFIEEDVNIYSWFGACSPRDPFREQEICKVCTMQGIPGFFCFAVVRIQILYKLPRSKKFYAVNVLRSVQP